MKLDAIAAVLGCDKSAASRLRAGKYERPSSDLLARYAALVKLVDEARREAKGDLTSICRACPRDDCTGCRVAEI